MGNLINELLKESNNKYIIFIGSTDYWDELVSYSDEYYVDWCVIGNTRTDYFNPKINKYHESRWANRKPVTVRLFSSRFNGLESSKILRTILT